MVNPRATTAVVCSVCNKTISRKADLPRHLKTHATNKEELMHACPYMGCTFKALQNSNLQTHLNVHSRERPHKCPAEGCEFACSDPGSLTRHRKERHDYQPKGSSSGHPSADPRKAARRRRRISPYMTFSSSPSGSASPTDSSTDTHCSPCPPLPKLPELYPSSSLFPAGGHVGEGSKNASAAYSTELITKHAQGNDAHLEPAPHPDNTPPLISGLGTSTAPEAPPVAEYPQLYAIDMAAQPVPKMAVSGEAFDNFYAQFNDWQPDSLPLPAPVDPYSIDNASLPSFFPAAGVSYAVDSAPAPASLPSPVVSYAVDNALVPASLPMPMVSYAVDNALVPAPFPTPMVSYTVDTAPIPTPAFLPPYEPHYTVDNAPFEYGGYGYTTEPTSFETLFDFSYPSSFATPGIGVGVYPRSVHDQGYQNYSYAATAARVHAGTSGFGMRGLYV